MAIYQGNKIIAGAGAGSYRNIGEIVPSLIPLSDAGLHLLDGAQISGTGVYAEFFNYIGTLVSTYPDLFCTEAQWQTSVSAYGVCGKFVYDSVNDTVRLPKITGIIEGTTDTTALGDLVEAGLPNIKGEWGIGGTSSIAATSAAGAMSVSDSYSGAPASSNQTGYQKVYFDASRYSTIYKDSFNKVQPQTIKAYYYMVVANSTKLSIQANLDGIVSDLNLKAGIDLANLTNAGKIVGAGLGMPSGAYDALTLGATGSTYAAPANGWFVLRADGNAANSGGIMTNVTNGVGYSFTTGSSCIAWLFLSCPALKGQQILIDYSALTTIYWFRFVYAEGSKSEQ